ncbi:hypothetical protein HCA61_02920 [Rhodococcus sp. HNM0563]|uniref:hypothetical protein n=1 Tax=unclassified Rhodococcus (in: high G+C Gram-positive bacteria) TaxID=192944 RepID=UPI00146B5F4C|nr:MULTISPECIES: hypothetical protein [unclassified Rhodococcus (in: high G+C Gram-positive bacteria)]MCK0092882.1 hypothetical protein [Rhodococcus sp. F64268]NLU61214.1 hypothetical protein [Rhodococcus sp. HNM0563]
MARIVSWSATAALVLAVLLAGVLNPVRPASVRTDALGPDSGEPVADYLRRAESTLAELGQDPSWALVSFVEPLDVAAVAELPGNVRVGQVLFRVPIDRVQTPLVTVAVSAHPEALRRAPGVAAGRLRGPAEGTGRAARVAEVSAERLASGCACVVGLVVRGTGEQLREVADDPAVRAVDALPSDAVAGRFSVRPLLPEHVEVVAPGPDDGEP